MLSSSRKHHLTIGVAACWFVLGIVALPVVEAAPGRGQGRSHAASSESRHDEDSHSTSPARGHQRKRHDDRGYHHSQPLGFLFSFWGHSSPRHGNYAHKGGVRFGLHCDNTPVYEVHRRWVPGCYKTRSEKVCGRPGYYYTRTVRVWVPGYWQTYKTVKPHRHTHTCSIYVGADF